MIQKTERFMLKMTPLEKKALIALADKEGLSMAATIRRLIRLTAQEQNIW